MLNTRYLVYLFIVLLQMVTIRVRLRRLVQCGLGQLDTKLNQQMVSDFSLYILPRHIVWPQLHNVVFLAFTTNCSFEQCGEFASTNKLLIHIVMTKGVWEFYDQGQISEWGLHSKGPPQIL